MKRLIVFGQELPLLDGAGGFFPYIKRMAGRNAACCKWLFEELPKGQEVVEHFGGVGVLSTLVQEILEPAAHRIADNDGDCVRQLIHAFDRVDGAVVDIFQLDARKGNLGPADIVINDYPAMTPVQYKNWGEHFQALRQYPLWVQADTGAHRLHLWGDEYAKVLGTKATNIEEYTWAVSHYFVKHYGYRITRAAHHYAASYFQFEPAQGDWDIVHHYVKDGSGVVIE